MTFVSKMVIAGYAVLEFIVIALLTWSLRSRTKGGVYKQGVTAVILLHAAGAAVPIFGTFLPESRVSFFLQRIGNIFLGYDVYFGGLLIILTLIIWIKRSVSGVIRTARGKGPGAKKGIKAYRICVAVSAAVALLSGSYGLYHAQQPVVKYFESDQRTDGVEKGRLKIALIADLHLSVNSHPGHIRKMVEKVNAENPDVVVVAGDIFTSTYKGLREPEKYSEELRKLSAGYGVYAVYGNHDVEEKLFCGFPTQPVEKAFRSREMEQFFDDSGFITLADETAELPGGNIVLAGRLDLSKAGDGTDNRMPVAELISGMEDKLVIVADHEPKGFDELREAGADVTLSGHTHNGQVFPGNIFVKLFNENGYGKKTFGNMDTFVTSGVGYFGPPMRIGTNSEVMMIDLVY